MHSKTSHRLIFLIALGLIAIISPSSWSKSKYQREANKTTLEIHSNVPNASILQSDIFSGNAGTIIEVEPGNATVTVSAPGYVDREMVFSIPANQNSLRTVNLGRIGLGIKPKVAAKKLLKTNFMPWKDLPSACVAANTVNAESGQAAPPCTRKTLLDDLLFIGISGISPAPKLSPESMEIYQGLFKAIQNRNITDISTQADLLFGLTVDSLDGFHLAAWSQLLGDNCHRSLQIIETAKAQSISSPQLFMIQSLCTEANGKNIAATKIMKAAAKFKPSSPQPFFHLSRMLVLDNVVFAKKALSKCLTDFPVYFPCFDLLNHLYRGNGETAKIQTLQINFKDSLIQRLPEVMSRFTALWQRKELSSIFEEASKIAEVLTDDFAINWLLVATAEKSQMQALAANANHWQIRDRQSAEMLLNLIGDSSDIVILLPAFEAFVKKYPQNIGYFYKLVSIMYKADQCQKALPMINLGLLNKKIQVSAGLLDIKGRCQLRVKDYDGATNTFNALVGLEPDNWLGYFNLAAAQEAGGAPKEAIASYRTSLSKNPPENYRIIMEGKLKK